MIAPLRENRRPSSRLYGLTYSLARLFFRSPRTSSGSCARPARLAMLGMWQRSASCSPDLRPAWAWCGTGRWGCSFRRANQRPPVVSRSRGAREREGQGILNSPLPCLANGADKSSCKLQGFSSPAPTSCRSLPPVNPHLYVTTDGGLEA